MYSDHFGLSAMPFQLTPDPRFWFESATHRKAMAYLGYGLAQGEGFIVITGEIGAGKTTLVDHLVETVDQTRIFATRISTSSVDGADLLRLAAAAFGEAADGDKATLIGRIERSLCLRAAAGQSCLLIVDEAQALPDAALEELRMLSNFQTGGKAMLQLLLLGQPELRRRLNHSDSLEQLRQRIIATHHLTGMAVDEVKPYVLHRLHLAGWQDRPDLAEDTFPALHRHSAGIPRRINALMTRALMLASLERNGRIEGSTIEAVVADLEEDEMAGEAALPLASDPHGLDLAARIAMLEAQTAEHGTALRRILRVLAEWMESDEDRGTGGDIHRAPAA